MNPLDVLKYGNRTVLYAVRELPMDDWTTPGVCGFWSVKEIIAHLASFEHVLVDVLALAGAPETRPSGYGPTLRAWLRDGQAFNDEQVPARAALSPAETLADYESTHGQTVALAHALSRVQFTTPGFLPAYGAEYDLEDFIAYSFYGHKREHSAQIGVFRDAIRR